MVICAVGRRCRNPVLHVTAATVSAEFRSFPRQLPNRFTVTDTAGSVAGVTPSPGSPPIESRLAIISERICGVAALRFSRRCSTEDVPGLNDLWSRVCHQGTTYSASPAVLPFLLRASSGCDTAARARPLFLAGSIVSAPQTTLSGYEPIVEALRVLAVDAVRDRERSRNGRTYAMQSVLAIQVDRLWSRVLDHLGDGELLALCLACRKDLYVVVGQYGFFVAAGEWIRDSETSRTEIRPLEIENFTGVGNWLYSICDQPADSELAGWIRCLFSVSRCPECRLPFGVEEAIPGIENN
jgi:hypothetical protein